MIMSAFLEAVSPDILASEFESMFSLEEIKVTDGATASQWPRPESWFSR